MLDACGKGKFMLFVLELSSFLSGAAGVFTHHTACFFDTWSLGFTVVDGEF